MPKLSNIFLVLLIAFASILCYKWFTMPADVLLPGDDMLTLIRNSFIKGR